MADFPTCVAPTSCKAPKLPPHRLSSGAHCPLMGKVSAVYTQDESAPGGKVIRKDFISCRHLFIRRLASSEKALVKESSTGGAGPLIRRAV